MRSMLTSSIVAVGLLAGGAGPALAGQAEPSRVSDALRHAAAMRSVAAHELAGQGEPSRVSDALRHAAAMRSVAAHELAADGPARVQIVRVTKTPAADDGYNWADGAIGAGLTAVLLLGAAGVAAGRRHPKVTAQ